MTAADNPLNDSVHSQPLPEAIKPSQPISDVKPLLPEATYVIQIPKDQIYRIPPPENERKIQKLANRKPRRSLCCRFFCYTIAASFILIILLAIAAAVVYFVYRPEKVKYSIDNISVSGVNLTSSAPVSPQLTVGIRFENPNDKITLFYAGKGSSINAYYDDVHLCNGELQAFEQKTNNVTVIQTALKGSDIVLSRDVHARLVKQEKGQNVPLKLNLKAPVKIKIGAVKTWEITVSVSCDMIVDRLSQTSKIKSKNCDYSVKLW